MSSTSAVLATVALPVPLYRAFDYRVPPAVVLAPGARVRVPFGAGEQLGVVIALRPMPEPAEYDYRPLLEVFDAEPLIPEALFALCRWVADYYQQPLGEVFAAALPGPLRRGQQLRARPEAALALTDAGRAALAGLSPRAQRQRALLEWLSAGPQLRGQWTREQRGAAASLRQAIERGWVAETREAAVAPLLEGPALLPEQAQVLAQWRERASGFGTSLLQGVTGSGKTEIYLRATAETLTAQRSVLVLVPEIGLTPQLLARFRTRFGAMVAGFHSGLTEAERGAIWMRARDGQVRVLVGTRSAVFVPLRSLGLVVVDEEHDSSFKQQEGLRYSARETAIIRARAAGAQVLLGSATPSLESLHNAAARRYRHLRLTARANATVAPPIRPIDLRGRGLQHGLSQPLIDAVGRHVAEGGQALLFINRRGYAPALLCHECGWVADCRHCAARLTLHLSPRILVCHHCGARQAPPQRCAGCNSNHLMPVGQGTERVEEILRGLFPQVRTERFDSDRLRNSRELTRLLDDVHSGAVQILVGTQMLAKGHDFAELSLVGVVNADQALFSGDFRAMERLGQLLTQVAGRAGRARRKGEVLLQTHEPEHPMLRILIEQGYDAFARAQLEERRRFGLPPWAHLALLRAEAPDADTALAFLEDARAQLPEGGPEAMGPVPAPMERRAGRYRAQLLLRSTRRASLQGALRAWVPGLAALPSARRVRWSIDVDPIDLL